MPGTAIIIGNTIAAGTEQEHSATINNFIQQDGSNFVQQDAVSLFLTN